MRSLRRSTLLLAFSCSLIRSATAQSTTDQAIDQGIKAFQAYHSSDIDAVNLQNGNLTVKIPLFELPQRGAQPVRYSLLYNAKQLQPRSACANSDCTPLMQMDWHQRGIGLQLNLDTAGGDMMTNYTAYSYDVCVYRDQSGACIQWAHHHNAYTTHAVRDSSGATHPLGLVSSGIWRSADGSGYLVQAVDDGGNYKTTSPDGIVSYTGTAAPACTSVDANGNQLCATDTIGRQWYYHFYPAGTTPQPPGDTTFCTGTSPTTATSSISVPAYGSANATATYKACYTTVNVITTYNLSEGTTSSSDVTVMQSLVLPDHTAWTFTYEPGTGNLTRIGFPTGGSIAYTWGAAPDSPCSMIPNYNGSVMSRTVDPNDGTTPQTSLYRWTAQANGTYSWSVKVTDPLKNDTITEFQNQGAGIQCNYFPHIVTTYQGNASANIVLKTVTTDYTTASGAPEYIGVVGVYPTRVLTDQNGMQSKVEMDYDDGFTALNEGTGIQAGPPFALLYGKAKVRRQYDWSTGQPGPLMQTTATSYLAFSDNNYKNANS